MDLRSLTSIINISFDDRPPVSLGTAVVDPLTINPFSSDKMLGSVLCVRKAHLFSEQERNVLRLWLYRAGDHYCLSSYKHSAPLELRRSLFPSFTLVFSHRAN